MGHGYFGTMTCLTGEAQVAYEYHTKDYAMLKAAILDRMGLSMKK